VTATEDDGGRVTRSEIEKIRLQDLYPLLKIRAVAPTDRKERRVRRIQSTATITSDALITA
jgi:hypothetical protein